MARISMENERPITFYVPNLDGGGAQKVVVELANSFKAIYQGPIHIVVGYSEGHFFSHISDDVEVYDLKEKRASKSLFLLSDYIKKYNPVVMMSTLNYANIILVCADLLVRKSNTKIFIREANIFVKRSVSFKDCIYFHLLKVLMKVFYRFSDGLICNSQDTLESLKNNSIKLPRYIDVIGNPITLSSTLKGSIPNFDFKYICAAGRLTEQKGFDVLIQAMSLLKDKNIKLVICGEGEDRIKLQKLIDDSDLKERVLLVGFLSNLIEVLSFSEMFILSSRWEGFGNVLIEALSVGLPVISTSCPGGPKSILDDGKYGVLVAVDDAQQLSMTIDRLLLNNPYAKESQVERAKDFSADSISKLYFNFLIR
jgi:glycosyltransferase involved in cell wall biosynthesis